MKQIGTVRSISSFSSLGHFLFAGLAEFHAENSYPDLIRDLTQEGERVKVLGLDVAYRGIAAGPDCIGPVAQQRRYGGRKDQRLRQGDG